MDRHPDTVAVAPGEGLVVRAGEVVMYIADASQTAAALIAAVESVAGEKQPGGVVAERLAALAFGADSASVAPFGVVAPTADGQLLLLRGNVNANIETADGTRELSGARAMTWVDELLPPTTRKLTIGGRPPLVAAPHSDLRSGVVPGGGFVLESAGAAQDAAPDGSADATAMLTVTAQPTAPLTRRVRPVQSRPAPSETSTLAPVAGVLATEDGAVYPLDRAYVIGRDPMGDEAVRTAHASPIVVHDDQHVSRVHAFVTVDGDAVFVRDASTPGGTFVAAPGAASWTQIDTTPIELEPGWSLRIGSRILTYRGADRP